MKNYQSPTVRIESSWQRNYVHNTRFRYPIYGNMSPILPVVLKAFNK